MRKMRVEELKRKKGEKGGGKCGERGETNK